MDAAAALHELLAEAKSAFAGGEAQEVERRAKAISALVRAERDINELAATRAPTLEEDDEAVRAELRRRLDKFVEADLADAPPEVLERIIREGA